jgi:hypothetical protein
MQKDEIADRILDAVLALQRRQKAGAAKTA